MSWSKEEIDELLVRYLDQELSSDQIERFERVLIAEPSLQKKLSESKEIADLFKDFRRRNTATTGLGNDFADRVIEAARIHVTEQADPGTAPWIARNTPASTVDSASRLQSRDVESKAGPDGVNRRAPKWRWLLPIAASGMAASLLAIAFWSTLQPEKNTFLTTPDQGLAVRNEANPKSTGSPIVILEDQHLPLDKAVATAESTKDRSLLNEASNTPPKIAVAPPQNSPNVLEALVSNNLATSPRTPPSDAMRSIEALSSTVGPDLKPTAEQLKMLEAMSADPNGMFLFVVEVGLPNGASDLDALRRTLDRHDIAWASQLEIDESIQSSLAKSRMIAEAGKQGFLPDFVDPNLKDNQNENEMVSLVFVKARASRLDAAIVEVMRQTDEFPAFSFDLAFDPPTNTLMNELRFIQEASLPAVVLPASQSVSHVIRRTRRNNESNSLDTFAAGPRRSKDMGLETRKLSKLPLDAEVMNPVSYALFIVRHARGDSAK